MELYRVETHNFQISAWPVSYPFKDYYRGDLENVLVILKCFSTTTVLLLQYYCIKHAALCNLDHGCPFCI